MSRISGSNVLITGGASGIGRQMARKLAKRGAQIIVWDINAGNLEKVLGELESLTGKKAIGHICDVSNREQVYAVAQKCKDEVGPLDILINNAGVVSGRKFLDVPDEKIEKTIGVNTMSLFWMNKAFLPDMIRRNRGHVVTVASAAGLLGVSGLADYSASKFAAVGFDEALRVELRKVAPLVMTTVVCPYFIDTGMFEGVKTRFSFLLPILKEEEVAEQVVRAIEKNKRRVVLPRLVRIVPGVRLLPIGVFDAIASFLGVNESMESFVGRAKGQGDR